MGFLDSFTPKDLENAERYSSFQIGDNIARIFKVEESYSKNTGNNMLVIHFENKTGAKIRYYIVDNEYKLQKLKGLYQAFRIPFAEKNIQKWIGKTGVVVCKEGRPYNGETRPEVNYVKPLDGPGPGIQQPRYNDGAPQTGTAGQASPQPPAQRQSPAAPPDPAQNNDGFDDGFEDDIPFI